ncbi:MAG: putative RiPP precursor [Pseudomonadota bacterium]
MTKSKYETPVLRSHGKVEAITKQNTGGASLDAGFSAGVPLVDLTTS